MDDGLRALRMIPATRKRHAEAGPRGRSGPLRIVMIVANDVTRDSRVLREASVLASVGHRVTVLGIMTARTIAPEVEVRDGFVIRRLRYRARPPGWWIPPDFYARVRYRSNRQYRIHRARVVALLRRVRRDFRLAKAGHRSTTGANPALSRWGFRLMRAAERPIITVTRVSGNIRWRLHRMRLLVRRARRARREAWVRKVNDVVAEGRFRLSRAVASPRWPRGMRSSASASGYRHHRPRKLLLSPVIGRVVRRAVGRLVAAPLGIVRVVGRGLRAWGSIVALLAWGTVYLVANRLTRGAIEWQTGWRWRWLGWARYAADEAPDADVWHGHDMTSLPAIVELKRRRGGLAIYDSHEVYLESGRHAEQPRWAKTPLEALERKLVAEVDAVVSVNHSVAAILARRLGCGDVQVLYNCPPRITAAMRGSPLRRAIGIPRSTPLLLYHGSLSPHRGIEQLLDAIQLPELQHAHLAFLGFGSMTERLRIEVSDPRFEGRVHLVDAVDPDELPRWLQGVDVAVAPIQASTLNHRNSSPNKVFEAIAAGTPVAGSDFPEFRRVIMDPAFGPLGALFDPADPGAIARAVREILDAPAAERAALRRRCRAAAARRWNWETESLGLIALYERLASQTAGRPLQASPEVRVA